MKVIENWESYAGAGIETFDKETQEIIKQIIKEEEATIQEKIDNFIEDSIKFFEEKGYSREEIVIKKSYYVNVNVNINNVKCSLYICVKTKHSNLFKSFEISTPIISSQFSKIRNEKGEKIIRNYEKINYEKIKQEIEKLREIIRKLVDKEELEKKLQELEEEEKELTKEEIEFLLQLL